MSEIGQTIIKAVREAAERNPFYTHDTNCVYVAGGAPACLIGHALWDLGIISPAFEHGMNNDEGIDAVIPALDLSLDHAELVWLEVAQTAQDSKHMWRDAVRCADEFDPTDEAW